MVRWIMSGQPAFSSICFSFFRCSSDFWSSLGSPGKRQFRFAPFLGILIQKPMEPGGVWGFMKALW